MSTTDHRRGLDELSRVVLSNPFSNGWVLARRQVERALLAGNAVQEIRARAESGHGTEARRLFLTWQFISALSTSQNEKSGANSSQLRPGSDVVADLCAKIAFDHKRLTRLVAASVEAYKLVNRFKGRSAAAKKVRQQTWEAVLGADLYHVHSMLPYIRRTYVSVHGETGTGKELIAQAVLWGTPAADSFLQPLYGKPLLKKEKKRAPIVAANVAALHEGTIESTLFGHEVGAFTGATEKRTGLIRSAHGGTIYLDEIGELQPHLQAKLLRVMQEMEVLPMGAETPEPADVRYVVATNRPMKPSSGSTGFREDFLQRICGLVVEVPPLQSRKEDIPEILTSFFRRNNTGSAEDLLDPSIVRPLLNDARFQDYDWPGNVRELENVVRRFLLTGRIELGPSPQETIIDLDFPTSLVMCEWTENEVCRWYASRAKRALHLRRSDLAKRLGIHRDTLSRRLDGGIDGVV